MSQNGKPQYSPSLCFAETPEVVQSRSQITKQRAIEYFGEGPAISLIMDKHDCERVITTPHIGEGHTKTAQ